MQPLGIRFNGNGRKIVDDSIFRLLMGFDLHTGRQ